MRDDSRRLAITGLGGSGLKALPLFTDSNWWKRYNTAMHWSIADEVRTEPSQFRDYAGFTAFFARATAPTAFSL